MILSKIGNSPVFEGMKTLVKTICFTLFLVLSCSSAHALTKTTLEFEGRSLSDSGPPPSSDYEGNFDDLVADDYVRFVLDLYLDGNELDGPDFSIDYVGIIYDPWGIPEDTFAFNKLSFFDVAGTEFGRDWAVSGPITKAGNILRGELLSGPAYFEMWFELDLSGAGGNFAIAEWADDHSDTRSLRGDIVNARFSVPDAANTGWLLVFGAGALICVRNRVSRSAN